MKPSTPNKMTNEQRALLVAESAHSDQKYGIYPYIYHPMSVAKLAREFGYSESIIIACILHDTLEDTELSYNDIKKAFGEEVAEIVYCVTDELGRDRKERKAKTYPKIRANWKATVVKIVDRIANIQHSFEYTPKLFRMYLDEHQDFCKNIMNDEHPYDEVSKAWGMLNKLIAYIEK